MAKIGRPLKGDAPREATVGTRLTWAEYHQFQELARREGISMADLLRLAAADWVRTKGAGKVAPRTNEAYPADN